MTLQVYQNPVGDCHQLGGVQLPQADIAKATQPGLFDDLPESAFTVDHRLIINARPADRMLLCLALDVSPSAVKVAVALAYHGWNSWPSRERLCRLTNLKSPHVTRAANELEKAGVIARRRKYHTGGNVGIQYIFNGLALAKATVEQEHPTLQGAITNLVTAPENAQNQRSTAITNLVTAPENAQNQRSTAITNLVTAPENAQNQRSTAITNLVTAPENAQNQRSTAITNLVTAPENAQNQRSTAITNLVTAPENAQNQRSTAITNLVTAPENAQNQRSTAITNLVTAEEEDQEASAGVINNLVTAEPGIPQRDYQIGNRAITNLVPEPEVTEPEGVTVIDDHQSNSGSSGSITPDAKDFPAVAELPAWYQQLERQLDAAIVPNWNTIQEAAMLAGWTDQVMASAARLYARNYRNQQVTNPGALFRKLASQEASKVAVPPKQSRPNYSDDRRRWR